MNKTQLRKFRDQYTNWEFGCPCEGLKLAVHFDEKNFVKRLNARWQPDPSGKGGYWWMPRRQLDMDTNTNMPKYINIFDADNGDGVASGTVLEYLNTNKMIEGLHGEVVADVAEQVTGAMQPEKFVLSDGASEYAVMRFADIGLVRFKEGTSGATWHTDAEGKNFWNGLVGNGFYRLSEDYV